MNCCVVVSHGCFSHVCWYRLIGIVGSWMIMEVSAKSRLMGWTFAHSNKHHLTQFGDLISSMAQESDMKLQSASRQGGLFG